MKVLVACEYSGTVRDAFILKGHQAVSCDILPTDSPGPHYQGDVLDILNNGWDLMIAHPPCTYLTNAGVRHLHSVASKNGVITKVHGEARWQAMREASEFFNILKDAPIPKICVENPVPHGYARELIGKYTQIIQPFQFGEDAKKATCLWLKNLPNLIQTKFIPPSHHGNKKYGNQTCGGYNKLSPSADRWKLRSKTYQGIADAMAEQWGTV